MSNQNNPAGSYLSSVRQDAVLRTWWTGWITWQEVWVTSSTCEHVQIPQKILTFAGPSLIFFIWSLYFTSSASSLAIFLSIDSALLSTFPYMRGKTKKTTFIEVWFRYGTKKKQPLFCCVSNWIVYSLISFINNLDFARIQNQNQVTQLLPGAQVTILRLQEALLL